MHTVFKLIGQLAASDVTALITGETGAARNSSRAPFIITEARRTTFAARLIARPFRTTAEELVRPRTRRSLGQRCSASVNLSSAITARFFWTKSATTPPTNQDFASVAIGNFERVGGNQPVQVDVRLIAATTTAGTGGGGAPVPRVVLSFERRAHPASAPARAAGRYVAGQYFLTKFSSEQHGDRPNPSHFGVSRRWNNTIGGSVRGRM